MTSVVLDTHVAHWHSAAPEKLTERAAHAIAEADDLVLSGISLRELAWLARNDKLDISTRLDQWLADLAADFRVVTVTGAIAARSVTLGAGFPQDPADQLIAATAIELACPLVTKDHSIRAAQEPGLLVIW